jgi:HTH-type transcriptional regulator/antitoxin HigA
MTTIALRVIKDQTDYDAVVTRINQLFNASPGTTESYELELLLLMVDNYQRKTLWLPDVEPVEVLKFVMAQRGLALQDIAIYLGGEDIAHQILSGKKSLTPQMIKALSTHLHIPVEALL